MKIICLSENKNYLSSWAVTDSSPFTGLQNISHGPKGTHIFLQVKKRTIFLSENKNHLSEWKWKWERKKYLSGWELELFVWVKTKNICLNENIICQSENWKYLSEWNKNDLSAWKKLFIYLREKNYLSKNWNYLSEWKQKLFVRVKTIELLGRNWLPSGAPGSPHGCCLPPLSHFLHKYKNKESRNTIVIVLQIQMSIFIEIHFGLSTWLLSPPPLSHVLHKCNTSFLDLAELAAYMYTCSIAYFYALRKNTLRFLKLLPVVISSPQLGGKWHVRTKRTR